MENNHERDSDRANIVEPHSNPNNDVNHDRNHDEDMWDNWNSLQLGEHSSSDEPNYTNMTQAEMEEYIQVRL